MDNEDGEDSLDSRDEIITSRVSTVFSDKRSISSSVISDKRSGVSSVISDNLDSPLR